MTSQDKEQPILNKMIEDFIAHCQGDPRDALPIWLFLGAEYMARECGREATAQCLVGLLAFVDSAKPTRPWPE